MEKIEVSAEVLHKLGDALGNVNILIGDIEDEVKKHTASLKQEIIIFKEQLSKQEEDNRLLVTRLEAEIESLKKSKEVAEKTMLQSMKSFSTDVSIKSYSSLEEINGFSDSRLSVYTYSNNHSTPLFTKDWWKDADVGDEQVEKIDWEKENADRVLFKQNLMIKEGWRMQNTNYDELQDALRSWTGKMMRWKVVKQGRCANSGKALFNVRFESDEDRNKIYALRKEIGQEGILLVGEALTYVERRERWKMLSIAERLKAGGREVVFENRRICVDGEWWKYYFGYGWERV